MRSENEWQRGGTERDESRGGRVAAGSTDTAADGEAGGMMRGGVLWERVRVTARTTQVALGAGHSPRALSPPPWGGGLRGQAGKQRLRVGWRRQMSVV